MIILILTLAYVVMVSVTLVFEYRYSETNNTHKKYMMSKCITSGLFIALAFASFALSGNKMFMWMLPAYIFCLGGDLFLALAHEIDNRLKNPQFLIGVISFAVAQIFICVAYLRILQWHIGWPTVLGGIVFAATVFLVKSRDYDFGQNAVPCSIYGFLVGLAAGLGFQMIISCSGSTVYVVLGLGSIVFLLSDLCLTMKLFWKKDAAWAGAAVLIFYYGAMWLIACATWVGR